jgi:glycosyltransferase involved in cell wall biosynthesis
MFVTHETSAPRVVACVPTWNAEEFIWNTLESLSDQTYPNLHVLISDDCSTDRTLDICRKFALSDSRFEVSRQPSNKGWTENVNTLLSLVNGEYFFIAAHDDLLHADFVMEMVRALESNPRAVLAHSDMNTSFADGDTFDNSYSQLDGVKSNFVRAALVLLELGQWWIPYRGVIQASTLVGSPGLQRNRAGEFAADWPWVLELALQGQFVRVQKTLCQKIYREGSLSRSRKHTLLNWIYTQQVCIDVIKRSQLAARYKLSLYVIAVLYIPIKALRLLWSKCKGLLGRL